MSPIAALSRLIPTSQGMYFLHHIILLIIHSGKNTQIEHDDTFIKIYGNLWVDIRATIRRLTLAAVPDERIEIE